MAVGTEWIRDHFSSLSGAAARALRDRLATGMAPERALAMGAIETTGHSMLDRAGSAVRGMLSAATPKSVALYASRDRDIDQARTQLAALQDPERAMGALESLAAEVARIQRVRLVTVRFDIRGLRGMRATDTAAMRSRRLRRRAD